MHTAHTIASPAAPVRSTPADPVPRRMARAGFAGLAWLFAAALVLQVFLAGWALFVNPAAWMWHRSAASLPTFLPLLLVISALIGRVPARRRRLAVAALVLVLVQGATADIRGIPGAFHPVNALLLFVVALRLLRRDPIVPPSGA